MICFCQCKLSQTREGGYIFSHHLIKLRKPIGSAEFFRGGGGGGEGGSATSSSGFLIALFCAGNLFPRAFSSHLRRKEVGTRSPRRNCNGWVLRDLHPPLASGHTHEMASFKINNINHHNQRAPNDCYKKCTD